jgi:N-dimethylarginine dimethylaminohydrolase
MKKVLMCPPDYFDIEYEINAWMHQSNQVDTLEALSQWQALYDIYRNRLNWDVELIKPVKGLPDMVFATDSCVIVNGKAMLSNFRYRQRQPETKLYQKWFLDHGFRSLKIAKHRFEGGGDSIFCGQRILAGYGFRSEIESHQELRDYFEMEVVDIKLINPYFFHLDTCLTVLNEETLAYYPGAIDQASTKRLKRMFPNIIEASLAEASGFGLNAVSNGHSVVTSNRSKSLLQKYRSYGFEVIATPITEFRKSGGGVKCMTLELGY